MAIISSTNLYYYKILLEKLLKKLTATFFHYTILWINEKLM